VSCSWRNSAYANPYKVGIFAILRNPFRDLHFIRDADFTSVNTTYFPAMLFSTKAGFKETARVACWIPESEPVRFSIGRATFCYLPNAFRYRACLIENVVRAGISRMLAGK